MEEDARDGGRVPRRVFCTVLKLVKSWQKGFAYEIATKSLVSKGTLALEHKYLSKMISQ